MKSNFPLFIVEAFNSGDNEPYTGNTAAVCLLNFDDDIDDETKLKIAGDMNQSETAFVSQGWRQECSLESFETLRWTLRWFTPKQEVQLCGHATLAAAHVIFNQYLNLEEINDNSTTILRFESKFKGPLAATMAWDTGLITLNFPANPTVQIPTKSSVWIEELAKYILGDLPMDTLETAEYSLTTNITVLKLRSTGRGHLANETLLRSLTPDFQAMVNVKSTWDLPLQDVVVTIEGGDPRNAELGGPHFYSRFFDPWTGVDGEDPVTGVAHTILVPFWHKEFKVKDDLDVKVFVAEQLSKRGGKLRCTLDGGRVHLTGSTRLVFKGSFLNDECLTSK